jgi:hypothetical protein
VNEYTSISNNGMESVKLSRYVYDLGFMRV